MLFMQRTLKESRKENAPPGPSLRYDARDIYEERPMTIEGELDDLHRHNREEDEFDGLVGPLSTEYMRRR